LSENKLKGKRLEVWLWNSTPWSKRTGSQRCSSLVWKMPHATCLSSTKKLLLFPQASKFIRGKKHKEFLFFLPGKHIFVLKKIKTLKCLFSTSKFRAN
jgi:hypothetical protein